METVSLLVGNLLITLSARDASLKRGILLSVSAILRPIDELDLVHGL